MEILDPGDFLTGEIFRQDDFLSWVESYNWSRLNDKKVLVRGCQGAILPPWAFMYITGKLIPGARSVRYGNEHDNIVVWRRGNRLEIIE